MTLFLLIAACCSPLATMLLTTRYFPGSGKPVVFGCVIGLMMAGMAFGLYNTSIYSDLTRYMSQAMLTRGNTLSQAFDQFSKSHINDTPLAILWFWVIGQSGNAQLYPATIAFVEYSILVYILADIAIEEGFSKSKFAVMLIFLIIATPIFDSISSVRSTPALSVGALAIYLEYYKKKRLLLALVLYICSPLIHSVGFIIFLVRFLCALSERSRSVALVAGFLILPGAFLVSDLVDPLFRQFGFSVVAKLQSYVSGGESDYVDLVTRNNYLIARKWVTFALLLISLVLSLLLRGNSTVEKARETRGVADMGAILTSISMSFVFFVTVPSYARFTYLAIPFLGICILDYTMAGGKRSRMRASGLDLSGLAYTLCFALYVFLMLVNMSRRVDMEGFAMHVLFGFFGAGFN